MAQWHISLTDPSRPEGEQFVAVIAVEGDWPEAERHHHDGITAEYLDALIMGPVPDEDRTPPELCGRLLRTRDEVEAAAGVGSWPYQ